MNTPTYQVEVACENCGHSCKVEILKGNPVESKYCPNCGCTGMLRRLIKPWVCK